MIESEPVAISLVARWNFLNKRTLEKQYKNDLSSFLEWEQKEHAEDWLLFPKNIGSHLGIDETSLSNGELYTIVTNKKAKGKKGAIVAIAKGTKASVVSSVLMQIPVKQRMKVKEVTLDMAKTMDWIVRECFPNCKKVIDRFHVQKLVSEALQEMRIRERWQALDEENLLIKESKEQKRTYKPYLYSNGDTKKQLLARSRHLLFKTQNKWTESQKERAKILFENFSKLHEGYKLSMMFRSFYEHSKKKQEAKKRLNTWYKKVQEKNFKAFTTAMQSIKNHEGTILNYFPDRSTNASAESFNAKIKGFRALLHGITDKKFFLFRVSSIYA